MSTKQTKALDKATKSLAMMRVAATLRDEQGQISFHGDHLVYLIEGIEAANAYITEIEPLAAGYDAARLEIESLHAQLEAVGAGGIEPLRKRCLHQISEPAVAQAPVASIYITNDGQREFDDWRAPLPVGRNELFAAPQPAAQALDAIVDLAQEAHRHWDADRDAKVGKLLMALSGYSPGYDKRADALHAAIAAQQGGA